MISKNTFTLIISFLPEYELTTLQRCCRTFRRWCREIIQRLKSAPFMLHRFIPLLKKGAIFSLELHLDFFKYYKNKDCISRWIVTKKSDCFKTIQYFVSRGFKFNNKILAFKAARRKIAKLALFLLDHCPEKKEIARKVIQGLASRDRIKALTKFLVSHAEPIFLTACRYNSKKLLDYYNKKGYFVSKAAKYASEYRDSGELDYIFAHQFLDFGTINLRRKKIRSEEDFKHLKFEVEFNKSNIKYHQSIKNLKTSFDEAFDDLLYENGHISNNAFFVSALFSQNKERAIAVIQKYPGRFRFFQLGYLRLSIVKAFVENNLIDIETTMHCVRESGNLKVLNYLNRRQISKI